jgi:cytochrome c peroxidase
VRRAFALLLALSGAAQGQTPYHWHLPRGFPTPAVPADNPMSDAKVALGRRLFFDPRLSVTGRYSCASCHDPDQSFSDGRAVAVGATGASLPHSAMPLVNVAYNVSFGWTDPKLDSLESQMLQPLLNEHPVELGLRGHEDEIAATLAGDKSYRTAFAAAFTRRSPAPPSEPPVTGAPAVVTAVTFDHIVKAIAAFERTLVFGDSPFDRYVFGGDQAALTPAAKRGMALFFSHRASCSSCHSGFNFSGNWRDAQGETGKASFASNGTTGEPMRVPTLRNIASTAPYMHDGRFATLDAVLDHYARTAERARNAPHVAAAAAAAAAVAVAGIDPRLATFDLSARERADLIAFLRCLTSPRPTGALDVRTAGR